MTGYLPVCRYIVQLQVQQLQNEKQNEKRDWSGSGLGGGVPVSNVQVQAAKHSASRSEQSLVLFLLSVSLRRQISGLLYCKQMQI